MSVVCDSVIGRGGNAGSEPGVAPLLWGRDEGYRGSVQIDRAPLRVGRSGHGESFGRDH
jgi:hypothetical protein